MKKLLTLFSITVLGLSTAFANVEMDLNLYSAPASTIKVKAQTDGFSAELNPKNAFGVETQFGFFFDAPKSFLDWGLGLSFGVDFNDKASASISGYDFDNFPLDFSFSTYLTLGPAFRFHVGDRHSFLVSPGLMCNFQNMWCDDFSWLGFYTGFNLDLGYRFWIVNKTGYHFGFNVGIDTTFPFNGYAYTSRLFPEYESHTSRHLDHDFDIKGGNSTKIYFGLCFNFGDKAPDKAR